MGTSISFHKRYLTNKNRLVTTQIVVFVLILAQNLCAASSSSEMAIHKIRHGHNKLLHPHRQSHQQEPHNQNAFNTMQINGHFNLRSICSDEYVSIHSESISAKTDKHFKGIRLEFRRYGESEYFYIKRVNSNRYVCFSKRGILKIKEAPSRGQTCLFKQEIIPDEVTQSGLAAEPTGRLQQSDNHKLIKIQSVANPKWYIGFKKNGDPMEGWLHLYKKSDKCIRFLRLPDSPTLPSEPSIPQDTLDFKSINIPAGT